MGCCREWAQKLTKFMKDFEAIVEQNFKNQKVAFKGTADFTGQKAATEQPAAQVQVQAAAQKPAEKPKVPKQAYDSLKKVHVFENFTNETLDLAVEIGQSIQIFNCTQFNLTIKGKVNMMSIMKTQNSSVTMDQSINQVDIIHCKNINVQVLKSVPTFNIENTVGVKLFLSNTGLNAEIMMFLADTVKVI